jgi:hypothetical protein
VAAREQSLFGGGTREKIYAKKHEHDPEYFHDGIITWIGFASSEFPAHVGGWDDKTYLCFGGLGG